MGFTCAPRRSKPLKKRPSNSFLTKELKKLMDSGSSNNEGRHTFNLEGLSPLITFCVQLAMTYLPEREVIEEVARAYIVAYGETGVRLFLKEQDIDWIGKALDLAFQLVLV